MIFSDLLTAVEVRYTTPTDRELFSIDIVFEIIKLLPFKKHVPTKLFIVLARLYREGREQARRDVLKIPRLFISTHQLLRPPDCCDLA